MYDPVVLQLILMKIGKTLYTDVEHLKQKQKNKRQNKQQQQFMIA